MKSFNSKYSIISAVYHICFIRAYYWLRRCSAGLSPGHTAYDTYRYRVQCDWDFNPMAEAAYTTGSLAFLGSARSAEWTKHKKMRGNQPPVPPIPH